MKVQLDYKLTIKQEKKDICKSKILHTITQVNDLLISCNNGTHTVHHTELLSYTGLPLANGNPV